MPVVADGFLALPVPEDVGFFHRDGRGARNLSKPVIEEVHVFEDVVPRLTATIIDAQARRTDQELLGDVNGDRHREELGMEAEGASEATRTVGSPAARRMSTTPVVPLTLIRSPVLIFRVAVEVPTTAGMPNSRESTAG